MNMPLPRRLLCKLRLSDKQAQVAGLSLRMASECAEDRCSKYCFFFRIEIMAHEAVRMTMV